MSTNIERAAEVINHHGLQNNYHHNGEAGVDAAEALAAEGLLVTDERLVYFPKREPFLTTPTRLEVLNVERDDNGRRPSLKVFEFKTDHPTQRYWDWTTDDELDRWYVPSDDAIERDIAAQQTPPPTDEQQRLIRLGEAVERMRPVDTWDGGMTDGWNQALDAIYAEAGDK